MKVIFEDNKILAVEKDPGMVVAEDASLDTDLLTLLKQYLKEKHNKPGNVFLGLVHRLDRPVGGIMIFAKNSKSASRLGELIRNHNFKKEYLAVLQGNIGKKEASLKHYLFKDEKTNKVKIFNNQVGSSRLAELTYKVLEVKNNFSLVKINLLTGRSHQIRAQFSHIGHPIWGDVKYGSTNRSWDIALWSYKIKLETMDYREFFSIPPNKQPWNNFEFIASLRKLPAK